jgi:hypothetical protein
VAEAQLELVRICREGQRLLEALMAGGPFVDRVEEVQNPQEIARIDRYELSVAASRPHGWNSPISTAIAGEEATLGMVHGK